MAKPPLIIEITPLGQEIVKGFFWAFVGFCLAAVVQTITHQPCV